MAVLRVSFETALLKKIYIEFFVLARMNYTWRNFVESFELLHINKPTNTHTAATSVFEHPFWRQRISQQIDKKWLANLADGTHRRKVLVFWTVLHGSAVLFFLEVMNRNSENAGEDREKTFFVAKSFMREKRHENKALSFECCSMNILWYCFYSDRNSEDAGKDSKKTQYRSEINMVEET